MPPGKVIRFPVPGFLATYQYTQEQWEIWHRLPSRAYDLLIMLGRWSEKDVKKLGRLQPKRVNRLLYAEKLGLRAKSKDVRKKIVARYIARLRAAGVMAVLNDRVRNKPWGHYINWPLVFMLCRNTDDPQLQKLAGIAKNLVTPFYDAGWPRLFAPTPRRGGPSPRGRYAGENSDASSEHCETRVEPSAAPDAGESLRDSLDGTPLDKLAKLLLFLAIFGLCKPKPSEPKPTWPARSDAASAGASACLAAGAQQEGAKIFHEDNVVKDLSGQQAGEQTEAPGSDSTSDIEAVEDGGAPEIEASDGTGASSFRDMAVSMEFAATFGMAGGSPTEGQDMSWDTEDGRGVPRAVTAHAFGEAPRRGRRMVPAVGTQTLAQAMRAVATEEPARWTVYHAEREWYRLLAELTEELRRKGLLRHDMHDAPARSWGPKQRGQFRYLVRSYFQDDVEAAVTWLREIFRAWPEFLTDDSLLNVPYIVIVRGALPTLGLLLSRFEDFDLALASWRSKHGRTPKAMRAAAVRELALREFERYAVGSLEVGSFVFPYRREVQPDVLDFWVAGYPHMADKVEFMRRVQCMELIRRIENARYDFLWERFVGDAAHFAQRLEIYRAACAMASQWFEVVLDQELIDPVQLVMRREAW